MVVQDGLITEVGNTADVEIPSDATILRPEEGNPWYLMPGLADMHTHESFFRRTQDEQNNFLMYLINGVTTILNMGDFSGEAPATSQAVLDGQFDGPTMYTAHFAQGTQTYSFITALSPERGRQLVRDAKRAGYDFIKLHGGIKTDVFDAIMDEATAQNMAVIGHGERGPGMEYILDHGMSMVAHTEEFIYTSFQFKTDTSKIPAVTDIVRRNDVFVTATLSAYETIAE